MTADAGSLSCTPVLAQERRSNRSDARRPRQRAAAGSALCLVGLSLAVSVTGTACGGSGEMPPVTAERSVATRFATAVLSGDANGARALLEHRDEPAVAYLLRRTTGAWHVRHLLERGRLQRIDGHWSVGFARRRTYADGRFETQSGDLVMFLARSRDGPRVRFFLVEHLRTRASTHHDAQLLPSKR